MRKILASIASLALAAIAVSVQAQPFYVTGEVTTPNWSPGPVEPPAVGSNGVPIGGGTTVDMQLIETSPGSKIYTCTLTSAQHGLTPGQKYEWKVAGAGFSFPNTPNGPNAQVIGPGAGLPVTFTWNNNVQADGFFPDTTTAPASNGFLYASSTRAYVDSSTSIEVTGAFQSERGGSDWTPTETTTTITLLDSGNTTLNDGIYSGTVTNLPAGSYDCKITNNKSFGPADFGKSGLGGDNLNFSVLANTDTITVTLDANTGRSKFLNDNPLDAPGPPFYAQSSAWGTAFTATEDLGTAVAGVYSKVYTIAAAGDYTARVKQRKGRSFSDSGDYPFSTTATNQQVRVIFDTNTYADGYLPSSNFMLVLDEATRAPLNTFSKVQPVGGWQSEFGSTDNNANESLMDMADNGTAPDTGNGDGTFAVTLTALANVSNAEVKAVGRRLGKSDTGYSIQFGGPVDGLTISGNNFAPAITFASGTNYVFQVDTATGRMRVGTSAGAPTRASYFTPVASVGSWNMYE